MQIQKIIKLLLELPSINRRISKKRVYAYLCKWGGVKVIKQNRIPEAVHNVLCCLSHVGYISKAKEREYNYRLNVGDTAVYKETKELLISFIVDLGKIK